MKYTLDFDNNSVEYSFLELHHRFELSEANFFDGDLVRNIINTTKFEQAVKEIRFLDADTETGTYNDGDFLRIGFARINDHVFIKNGKPNYTELKAALWEIAHPETGKERKQ